MRKADQCHWDVNRYLALIKQEQPDTIILSNPNNSDGGYVTRTEVRAFLETLRPTKLSRSRYVILRRLFAEESPSGTRGILRKMRSE